MAKFPFDIDTLLSRGAQGAVYKGTHKNKRAIAIKAVYLSLDGSERAAQINSLHEKFKDIVKLNHKNLVAHYDVFCDNTVNSIELPVYHLLMELCTGGNLHDAMKYKTEPFYIQKWTKEILDGIEYLHSVLVVHRDIKGANILLTSKNLNDTHLKIGDLGDLKRLTTDATKYREVSHGKGTWAFMSPEMITGHTQPFNLGRKTDIWSLGCVVLEMLRGDLPLFYKQDEKGHIVPVTAELAVLYFVGNGGMPHIPNNEYPELIVKFVQKCLKRDPADRPSATELKSDKFLTAPEMEVRQWKYNDTRAEPPTSP